MLILMGDFQFLCRNPLQSEVVHLVRMLCIVYKKDILNKLSQPVLGCITLSTATTNFVTN